MLKLRNGLIFQFVAIITLLTNCTKLEDKVIGKPYDNAVASTDCASAKGVVTDALGSTYARLFDFQNQDNWYALLEHPSDEMMGPTRGTDWDDFGTWRKLHQHTWDANHNQVISTWDNLNNGVFRAKQVIYFATPIQKQTIGEGKFLKAFFSYYIVDLFGQLPYVDLGNTCSGSQITSRAQSVDTVIADLNYAVVNLASGSNNIATKESAEFLLAKTYLNRGVFKQDPKVAGGPYNFPKPDMDSVIKYCDALINSGKYQLTGSGKYFDNFHWQNDTRSKELILVVKNTSGSPVANVRSRFYMGLHYNQTPSGWNGFTTLADFYNSFEPSDERIGGPYPGVTDKIGLHVGFLKGQQYDEKGGKLFTRGGDDLSFTPDVSLAGDGEEKGIRVVKYVPQPGNIDNMGTDLVFYRYADVILMKAEAILRGGTATNGDSPLTLVNNLRTIRGASVLAAVDLKAMLAERGRELYYEGWRRNDQIRFSSFLQPVDQRPTASDQHLIVFPIPQQTIDVNPKWSQNFGY